MPTDSNPTGRQIRRAQRAAALELLRRQNTLAEELEQLYREALARIQADLEALANAEGVIPIEQLPRAERIVQQRLAELAATRNAMIEAGLAQAVALGADAWSAAATTVDMGRVGQDVLDFVREFRDANGLQFSDRLWRLDRGARERIAEAIETAIVQGHSAAQAARRLVTNGENVPEDLLSKAGLARVREIQNRAGNALLTGEGNPYYNAERVMRTEINRAYGETAIQAAAAHPDVVAVRFLLSPRHPEPDICDFHASANLHGLGPGVYPINNHPWPAHPNTLSYMDPVFVDEISVEAQRGRQTITDFLNGQPAAKQNAMLGGKAKGWAWRAGHLDPRELNAPWKRVRARLQRAGIDIPEEYA